MTDERKSLDEVLALRRDHSGEVVNVDEPTVKLVIFALADEWLAFYGDKVREILPQMPVFLVPGCPPSLEGVMNVRGDIESVVHLAAVLGLPDAGERRGSSILLGEAGGMRSGIRVDAVVDVLDLPESAIQPPLGALPERLRAVVAGTTLHRGRPVTLLDLDRIFEGYRQGLG